MSTIKVVSVSGLAAMLLSVTTSLVCFSQQPDDVDKRLRKQHHRIQAALNNGNISKHQAEQLQQALDDISNEAASLRQTNGGSLRPEQLKRIENELNQNSNLIDSGRASGDSQRQGSRALGPKWAPGPDGAQNPRRLLQRMKPEERRELRQERQAMEQKIEGQQMEYEKEMTQDLGAQRKNILRQKRDLERVRADNGAN